MSGSGVGRGAKQLRQDSIGWDRPGTWARTSTKGITSQAGPDLIVSGSSTLTSVLLGQGLVDEVVLIVYPVFLGRGKRFFSERVDARELAFVSTKATPTGVLLNTYRHVGPLRT